MAERNVSPPRRLRACASCARAKAKCRFKEEHVQRHIHLCDRCETLKQECLPQTTTSLRKPRRVHQGGESTLTLQPSMYREDMDRNVGTDAQQTSANERPWRVESQAKPKATIAVPQPPFGLSWLQATQILRIFREEYIPQFPFITISGDRAAEALSKDNPFLFRAVMLVAAPLLESKAVKNKRNTLAYLGYRSLVEEDKTLDILQGMLVIVAWAHKSCIDNSQVVNLTYLALGYAHSLGITQEPVLHNNNAEISSDSAERAPQDKTHLLEEQRTFLGLYCALSIISTRQSRRNSLDTPYIETCLKNIGQSSVETSDFAAAHIVHLVRMSERLSEGFGEPHKRTLSRPYAFLLEGTGRHFQTDLNRLAASATYPSLASHSQTFELHRLYLLVRMYEPAVIVASHPDEGVLLFVFLLICLRNCIDAMRSFFDLFLELPVDLMLRYSIVTSDHVIFVTLQAVRLLLVKIPDWDVQSARETLDLGAVLDQIVSRYEEADVLREEAVRRFGNSTQTEENSDEMSNLSKLAREIRWLKYWFETKTQEKQTEDDLPIELGRGEYEDKLRPTWYVGLLEDIDWNIG